MTRSRGGCQVKAKADYRIKIIMQLVQPPTDEQITDYRAKQQQKLVGRITDDLMVKITSALAAGQKKCTVSVASDEWYVTDSDSLRYAQGALHAALTDKYTSASIRVRWIPDPYWACCWKPRDILSVTLIWI